jgi:hypothetical protein
MRNDLPTRRRSERPKAHWIGTTNYLAPQREVPTSEYPAPYWVYTFGVAGILIGAPSDVDVSMANIKAVDEGKDSMQAFAKKYSWDRMIRTRFMPREFMRMIAKTGYSYAVANMGYNSFRPLVIDAILDSNANVSHFVGQNQKWEMPIDRIENGAHRLRIEISRTAKNQPWRVIVHVRLFSLFGTPTYHAVVGEIESPEKYNAIVEKLTNRDDVDIAVLRKGH